MKLNGLKMSVKWSLKTWNFLQMEIQLIIGFLNLFKGSIRQNSEGAAVESNLSFLKVYL